MKSLTRLKPAIQNLTASYEAATVSRSSPGTLAYKGGALNPVQKAYPAKTN
jgi:hypothetical protein